MYRVLLAIVIILFAQVRSFAAMVGMFDPTGIPLLERLMTGSGIDFGAIDPDRVDYIGAIENGQAQAGLFEEMVLHGQNDIARSGHSSHIGPNYWFARE
jgi:hypothetical protein